MNTTSFMDKQIMDLSEGSPPMHNSTNDFIDQMKTNTRNNNSSSHRSKEEKEEEQQAGHGNGVSNKEYLDMLPSYDFQPIRHLVGASSPATLNFGGGSPARAGESKSNAASPIRNYGSVDSLEPANFNLGKDRNVLDALVVSEIDRTMKKHADDLIHALEGVSARLTQLESRSRHLENSVDDLKISVGNSHGSADGKMRQLEDILRDVQSGVKDLKDKQEIVEAQLNVARIQASNPKVDPQLEPQNAMHLDSRRAGSASQQSHQQLPPPVNLPFSLPAVSHPNAPSQPIPQSLQHTVQHPNQFSQNQIPPVPQQDPYYPAPGQNQGAPNQPYQLPPGQQPVPPSPVPPHQQFQPTSQPQYSQPPPPLSQQHTSLAPVNPSQLQPTLGHHAEETPYNPSQNYPPSLRQPTSHTASGPPPSQQYYNPASQNTYEPPSSRPNSGYSSGYNPPAGLGESYHYGGPPTQYGGTSSMKPQQLSSSAIGQGAGSSYPQLPTARVLPHALPTPSGAGGGSSPPGAGSRLPIDDVIDQVARMGFSRDHVRATVRQMADDGQSVDLNVVIDKLTNGGEVQQPPRAWYGR